MERTIKSALPSPFTSPTATRAYPRVDRGSVNRQTRRHRGQIPQRGQAGAAEKDKDCARFRSIAGAGSISFTYDQIINRVIAEFSSRQ